MEMTRSVGNLGVQRYFSFAELPNEVDISNKRYVVQVCDALTFVLTVVDGQAAVNFASLLENVKDGF